MEIKSWLVSGLLFIYLQVCKQSSKTWPIFLELTEGLDSTKGKKYCCFNSEGHHNMTL